MQPESSQFFIPAVSTGFLPIDSKVLGIVAVLVTIGCSLHLARRLKLDLRVMYWTAVLGFLGSVFGGHLFHVLAAPKLLVEDPLLLFRFLEGGKGVFGAFIGAGVFGAGFLYWKKSPLLAYADAATPAVALGYAIARIGCFLNGDDFGILSNLPWAVQFPRGTDAFANHLARGWVGTEDMLSLPVHPVQLYHSIAGFILFLILILQKWQRKWHGSRLAMALVSYGIIRFVLQFFRGDAIPILGFLDINQIFCLLFLLSAGILWWFKARVQRLANKTHLCVTTETLP